MVPYQYILSLRKCLVCYGAFIFRSLYLFVALHCVLSPATHHSHNKPASAHASHARSQSHSATLLLALESLFEVKMAREQSLTTQEIELILDSDSDCASVSSLEDDPSVRDSESGEDEESQELFANVPPSQAVWTESIVQNTIASHNFTGESGGKMDTTSQLSSSSTPLDVFLLYFSSILQLIVTETNRYYHQYLNKVERRPNAEPDGSESEMWVFLALILQMGHDVRDKVTDYWSKMDQFYTPFFGNCLKRRRFLHILRFLHFADLTTEIDKNDENYDRLWKIREVFEMLRQSFEKYYYPSEHLSVDEVIVLFKGRVIFKQYIPKKHKRFGIKIYKLCDRKGYTYDMSVYLGKGRNLINPDVTASHATVTDLTSKIKERGINCTWTIFFLLLLYLKTSLEMKSIVVGQFAPIEKDSQKILGRNLWNWKEVTSKLWLNGNLTTLIWKDRREVYILTNMHAPPTNGNFCDENGKALEPHNHCRLQYEYGICWQSWQNGK